MPALDNFSATPDMTLVLTDDGRTRIKIESEGLYLEEWLANIFAFPSDKELDSQISSLRAGDESAMEITRKIGKMNISMYKPY